MKPIAFMRLRKVKDYKDVLKKHAPEDLIVQEKIDGFKCLAVNDGALKLYTRRGKEFQDNVPVIVESLKLPNNTSVLGEISYIDEEGKQSISEVQSIVGSSSENALEIQENLPGHLVYYVYDILEYRGKDTTALPFIERDHLLRKAVKENKHVAFLKNYSFDQAQHAIDNAIEKGGEGIVIKPKDSPYVFKKAGENEPFGEQVKFKPSQKANYDDVIIQSYELGKQQDGYQKAIFPAFQYKDGELFEVGKLSGLDRLTEKHVKDQLDKGKKLVVEVSFQERMPSGKFRHMGWVRLRPDKPLKSVTVDGEQ